VLHRNAVILSLETDRVPHVSEEDRLTADHLGDDHDGLTRLTARFGFQDELSVPRTLHLAAEQGLLESAVDIEDISYFLSRITLVRTEAPGLSRWRKKLFLTIAHNAANPVEYFDLPGDRTVVMGEQVDI